MIMTSLQTIQLDPHNFPNPTTFLPERHLEPNATSTHRTTWRSFERGIRACLGQELATDKMRVILLLTARWFDFEPIVEPAKKQRVDFTNLDLFIGDQVFQQLRMAATPRDGIPMRIKSTGRF
jgi:cytochrome P450